MKFSKLKWKLIFANTSHAAAIYINQVVTRGMINFIILAFVQVTAALK